MKFPQRISESLPETCRWYGVLALIVLVCQPDALCLGRPIRVDLGMDSGRSDTATPGWEEWQVPNGEQATRTFSGVQLTLRANGDADAIEGQWYKAALASGATMATDGIVAKGDGTHGPASLELEIQGLSPGNHSLVTYHNFVSSDPPTKLSVVVNEAAHVEPFLPSHRAATNEAAQSAYLEFEAREGEPVIVTISGTAKGRSNPAILNGLELDASDPKRKATDPQPTDGDWHVDGDSGAVNLSWKSPKSAKMHRVFITSSVDQHEAEETIENATADSSKLFKEVRGRTLNVKVQSHSSQIFYCWRVDTVHRDGTVTKGDLWQFRVRQLAFPGAEGYGRFAIGGRGGRIIKVTNLNDSGPGSLREAVEADGPRIVVFDVSGRIVLERGLVARDPYLTIAGQTAPGKGICLSNYGFGLFGTHDCVVRHIRVRPGDTAGETLDGMGMASSDHSIIDHCSISWTQDESFSSRGAKNITLQRTLISEALNVAGHKNYKKGTEHGYAASIGGDVGSFHHNLLAHCSGRNWSMAGGIDKAGVHAGRLDIRNNVVYNWRNRTTDGGAKEVNFVNNYYLPGPASQVFHVLMPQHEHPFGPQRYFVIGNVMEGRYDASQRYAGVRESPRKPMKEYIVEKPFFESFVTTSPAKAVFADVLDDVGCNRPQLDEHDRRVIGEVNNRTTTYEGSITGYPGLPDSQQDVGGWEDYPEIHRPDDWDPDGDGLPNWWEEEMGLNPNSPAGDHSDADADPDGNGYTNIEEYLQRMATTGYEADR